VDWLSCLLLLPCLPLALGFINMCCCVSDCENCSAASPEQYQVDLASFSSDGTFCFECHTIDGTYIVNQAEVPQTGNCVNSIASNSCNWGIFDNTPTAYYVSTPNGCGVIVTVQAQISGSNYRTLVEVLPCAGNSPCAAVNTACKCQFLKDHGTSKPDCSAFSALSIPFFLGSLCGTSSATCAMTSL
jgi:hypothetical protein